MRFNCTRIYLALVLVVFQQNSYAGEPLDEYETRLQKLSLPEFVVVVKKLDLQMPKIQSKWKLERSKGHADAEIRKRLIGKLLMDKILEEANRYYNGGYCDAISSEILICALIALSKHIRQGDGYGNVILHKRCEELAYVILAYLAKDIEYPHVKHFEMLLTDISNESDDLAMRMYESECPLTIKVRSNQMLRSDWEKGVAAIDDWRKNNGINLYGSKLRAELPDDLKFYCDDEISELPTPRTSSSMWEGKYHSYVFGSMQSKVEIDVSKYLVFRKTIGEFPAVSPSWWKEGDQFFDTPVKAAFYDKWGTRKGNLYATAALVHTKVSDGQFWDRDTLQVRIFTKTDKNKTSLKSIINF